MTEIIELETDRLRLRQWKPADRELFAKLNADLQVMEFFPNVLSQEESDAMADRIQALIEQQGWDLWAVEIKNTQQFIGYVGLHVPTYELPFNPCVEVGWRLAHEHWGQGYAPEAALEALKFGFESLNLSEIVSFTALNNHRSQRVMEKIGMQRSPETFQHPGVPIGGKLREHCLYRLSRSNWLQQVADKCL
jgi:RimJ/RimL family protein N-acetyltransferase